MDTHTNINVKNVNVKNEDKLEINKTNQTNKKILQGNMKEIWIVGKN